MTASLPALTIGRLVAHGRQDRLDLRLRLEAGIGLADLRAGGLPPNAILCVRRLADPLPWHLPVRGGTMPPDRWRAAVTHRLDSLARVAGRPAFGEVADDAEAVLFASQAELLAALAREWLTRGRLDRWWWAHLAPRGAPATTVITVWRTHPESVPAALDLLAGQFLAMTFCGRLATGEATDLLDRVAGVHGMVLPAAPPVGDQAGGHRIPWEEVAPEVVLATLAPEAALLAGVSLTLARRPALARSRPFAAAAVAWLLEQRHVSGSQRNAPHAPRKRDEHAGAERPLAPTVIPGDGPSHPTTGESAQVSVAPGNVQSLSVDTISCPELVPSPASEPSDHGQATAVNRPGSQPMPPDASMSPLSTSPSVAPPREEAAVFSPERVGGGLLRASSLRTNYGGAFFLANVALALGLYPDFTRPADRGLDVDFWDFLRTASRDLLNGLPDDPLWELFRELTGEDVATADPEVRDWRIPPSWLDPVGTGSRWRYRVNDGRLRVTHELGFAIVDVPFGGAATANAVSAELGAYPAVTVMKDSPGTTALGRSPEGEVGLVTPYIRVRLAQALGVTADDAGELLIAHPALVEAWPESIRVTFALDRHPIAIRLAGLDRDPGWIPAAGRSIRFAFEPASE